MSRLIPEMPRSGAPDVHMRRFLGRLALLWAIGAFALALVDDVPADLPMWTLEHPVVYRALVWLVLFATGALAINAIALIFHGWLFTGVSAGPVEANAEQVANEQEGAIQSAITAVEKLAAGADEVSTDFHERIAAVEMASGIEPPDTPPASLTGLLKDDDEATAPSSTG